MRRRGFEIGRAFPPLDRWTRITLYALYSGEDQRDPQRIQPESSPRAIRGGGWTDYNSQWIRAAVRGYHKSGVRYRYVGFRCARGAKK